MEEALSKLDGLVLTADNVTEMTDLSGRLLLISDPTLAIDSPLENLAIAQAILEGYETGIEELTIYSGDYTLTIEGAVIPQIVASTLAAAADKTGVMEIDEVAYLASFLSSEENDVEENLKDMVVDYENWQDPDLYNVEVTVLNPDATDPDDLWDTVTLSDVVEFNDVSIIDVNANNTTGLDYFTQAVDDSLQVLEYIHDNTLQ